MHKISMICLAAGIWLLLLLSACNGMDAPQDTSTLPADCEADSERLTTSFSETQNPSDGKDSFPIYTPPVETEPHETERETYQVPVIPDDAKLYSKPLEVNRAEERRIEADTLKEGVGQRATHIRIIPTVGYACLGFEIDGVRYEGNVIPLSMLEGATETVLLLDYATHELPILNIVVNGEEITSKTEYVDMTLSLENTEDALCQIPGGIRVRGNSTATFSKTPYRIKFEQKQSLFGLPKAKSWVLLAEYLDPSCMHNYAAMYLGQASDALAFTPTVHHVNLYLDGVYMGIYSLCEQVHEEEGRLDLEIPITPDMTELMDYNFLVCMDERAPEYPDAKKGETYFYISSVGRYFELKYPRKEAFPNEAQFKQFFKDLQAYYEKMADAFLQGNANWIGRNTHVESLVDHLIVDQIMGERDHVWKSFYTYHEKRDASREGRISFGPIWDYDYSLRVPWTGEPNVSYDVSTSVEYSNFFFQGLMNSRLSEKVNARYKDLYSDVLAECIKELESYRDSVSASLMLNQERWYSQQPDITEKNLDFLIKFLKNRQTVLKRAWK